MTERITRDELLMAGYEAAQFEKEHGNDVAPILNTFGIAFDDFIELSNKAASMMMQSYIDNDPGANVKAEDVATAAIAGFTRGFLIALQLQRRKQG